jgi:hypothetical protein
MNDAAQHIPALLVSAQDVLPGPARLNLHSVYNLRIGPDRWTQAVRQAAFQRIVGRHLVSENGWNYQHDQQYRNGYVWKSLNLKNSSPTGQSS